MKYTLKSSVYYDLIFRLHADVADDLGISLDRETEKVHRILENGGLVQYLSWIESKLNSSVVLLRASGSPEYTELTSIFLDEQNSHDLRARAYAHARQILYLFRKLEDIQCCESDDEALSSFFGRMSEHEKPLTTAQRMLSLEIETIMPSLLDDLPQDGSSSVPDIGPGASYEKRPHVFRPEFFSNSQFSFSGAKHETPPRDSRACAVKKTWKRKRLIFIEPSSRMLIQKGLQAYMYQAADRYPLKRYVSFSDQQFQRSKLRKPGAASLDLSDASDHIDRRIVWMSFRRLPVLRALLFEARGKAEKSSQKNFSCFATMGNATTFPVMTLLLTCVVILAEETIRSRGRPVPWSGGVFGDDIVCHESVYGTVRCILTDLGLKVNESKSYVLSAFCESCGLDLFHKHDVTPIKVKSLRTVDDADFSRLLRYTNALFIAGYWRAADVVLSELLSRWPKTTFGPVGAPDCVWSYTLETYDGPWSRDYQRRIAWLPTRTRVATQSYDSEANLSMWLAHGRRPASSEGDQNVVF